MTLFSTTSSSASQPETPTTPQTNSQSTMPTAYPPETDHAAPLVMPPPPLPQYGVTEETSAGRARGVPTWQTAARTIGKALLIVVVFYICYSGIRLGLYGFAAYQNVREIASLYGQSGRTGGGRFVAAAYPHAQDLHRIALAAEGNARVFMPIFHGLSVLPLVGETAGAVPKTLDAGRGLADVGMGVMTLMLQTAQVNPDASVMEVAGQTFREQVEGFQVLSERATAIRADLDQIHLESLVGFAVAPVHQMQAATRLAEAGLHMTSALPGLLGMDGPRTYILLVQNNHELRATGGFISAIGDITINGGQIGELRIEDSYRIANHEIDHPAAPPPMQEYMDIDLIFVRDANWSPDFPTTSALMQALYTQDTGVPVHGVIAIDLHAVRRLVQAVGPLVVEGADVPITGENFVEQIIRFWDSPLETGDTLESAGLGQWWRQRKDFMPAIAEAALGRLRSGRFNPLAVAGATVDALDSGSIQVWLTEPGANQTLTEFEWNGRIAANTGEDYLAFVDSNLGYNKVDAVLERRLDYAVEWQEGRGIATATMHYRHPLAVPNHVCNPEPRYGENYTEMTQRCYFNFVRIFIPRGSEMLRVDGIDPSSMELQTRLGPNNTDVYGGYFVLSPGSTHQVTFTYVLPPTITSETYGLRIRRQAGLEQLPVHIRSGGYTLAATLEKTHLTWFPIP